MKAAEVQKYFDTSLPQQVTQSVVCQVVAALREVLVQYKVSQSGITGIIARVGIGRVVALLDDYLAGNCGAG